MDDLTTAIRLPVHVVEGPAGARGLVIGGHVAFAEGGSHVDGLPLLGTVPALYPEWLGDRAFLETHGCRFPYIVGEMAHGIASPGMVIAAARAGLLGFLGTAGLSIERIGGMIAEVRKALDPVSLPWGANLIHMPDASDREAAVADLYLALGVRRVSASAFLMLTPSIVRYAFHKARAGRGGTIERHNFVFAKISRPEVAKMFMTPAPAAMIDALVRGGHLTSEEAGLAARHPVAQEVTVEADSGGHTDNRPLNVILPRIMRLRDELAEIDHSARAIRLGAAGGIGTPGAAASAFSLGAAYILTGSINQVAVESGLSTEARAMLAGADVADVAMAASADMFELGVRVQVLKRGTLFAPRANLLYALYSAHDGIDAIDPVQRAKIEREIFRAPLERIWEETKEFFQQYRPAELARAARDPKHRMALIFRWYLGSSARWPISGETQRSADYQIWCGPALGAFNAWVAGTFLADPRARTVEQIGKNLLEGAAAILRAQQFRAMGLPISANAFRFTPRVLH